MSDIPIKWRRDLTLQRISATTDESTTPVLSGRKSTYFIIIFY